MKKICVSILFAVSLCPFSSLNLRANGQDYLEPEKGNFNDRAEDLFFYDRDIVLYLLKEQNARGSDYDLRARVVCLPSFFPEWSVSVWENGDEHWIELAVAEELLWESEQRAKVKIKTSIVPVDAETAAILHSLWTEMLVRVRYPAQEDDIVSSTDGQDYHFSCIHRPRGLLAGVARCPTPGTLIVRMTELADLLRDYAGSPEAERPGRAATISEKAKQMKVDMEKIKK